MRGLDCGPLISRKQFDRVSALVDQARHDRTVVARGSVVLMRPTAASASPPLLGDVPVNHPMRSGIFGPVLAAFAFVARTTPLRLRTAPARIDRWHMDATVKQMRWRKIVAGQVYINNYGAGGGIEIPFSG